MTQKNSLVVHFTLLLFSLQFWPIAHENWMASKDVVYLACHIDYFLKKVVLFEA